ncbi:MAG: type I-C CRISPR-associated protein Cas5 [Caldilineaceae bacterium]|nr:type I-C CRISPR-associated protein Cas5 [Caldilineaceae bacterium]
MGYGVTIRVEGDYALFTRPEMKVERVSYDVITPSAARGVIEAIYWKPAIRWVIDRIHVLNEIEFTNIRRNEVSEKTSTREAERRMNGATAPFYLDATDARQQRAALVLKNVDYIIEAHFELVPDKAGQQETVEKHYNIALRRLRKGQHYHAPYLGTREFSARVQLVEDGRIPQSSLVGERELGWMLYDLDFTSTQGIQPQFFKAVMRDGVIDLTQVERRS